MKKKYLIANWKQYLTVAKSEQLFEQLLRFEKKNSWGSDLYVVVAPPVLAMPAILARAKKNRSRILIASQDCGFADEGAFTGSISPKELKKLGVAFVLVGHSERREWFAETNILLRKKLLAATYAGLKTIYCVGETKDERHGGRAYEVIREQLIEAAGDKVLVAAHQPTLVAYEPRWAIGTGIAIEPAEAGQMHRFIDGEVGARGTEICYGGSVSPENILSFIGLPHTVGTLVGKASTNFKSIAAMIQKMNRSGKK